MVSESSGSIFSWVPWLSGILSPVPVPPSACIVSYIPKALNKVQECIASTGGASISCAPPPHGWNNPSLRCHTDTKNTRRCFLQPCAATTQLEQSKGPSLYGSVEDLLATRQQHQAQSIVLDGPFRQSEQEESASSGGASLNRAPPPHGWNNPRANVYFPMLSNSLPVIRSSISSIVLSCSSMSSGGSIGSVALVSSVVLVAKS